MTKEKTVQSEIGGYISMLLRSHFGKGPTSVFVSIQKPYIVIHFRGFVAPMEAVLLKQNEWKRVLETRDLLVNELKDDIKQNLQRIAKLNIREFYADWDLEKETGLLIGVSDDKVREADFDWPGHIDQNAFDQKIVNASEKAEKKPGSLQSFWLDDRTILIQKSKILVGIENALIAEGYTEILKLVKRPLERKLLLEAQPEKVLGRNVIEIFLDWNFNEDISYIVFMLEPVKRMHQ
ncbi:DUF2294 domain-containing protein [Planococcus beigongshangi]|uniref:DUF2294 domain-containing protein n=1 Tax=Planococcus beigongshangi TaxID=2782536 RepID=UPI00193C05C5|nr:Na-translocating system protein MpsC family protein [Planococcus beigongshangi]